VTNEVYLFIQEIVHEFDTILKRILSFFSVSETKWSYILNNEAIVNVRIIINIVQPTLSKILPPWLQSFFGSSRTRS
jgi:hypothetical protein